MASTSTLPGLRRAKFLPIVERELRMAARSKAPYRWRTLVAAAGLALMGLVTASLTADLAPAAIQGRYLFLVLLGVSVTYAVTASVAATADSVSREKREGTLGLLFLTDLRGMDIIFGKLAAGSLNTVYGLIGLLPLLAIPVMLGGVSIETGIVATLAVLNVLFLSLSVGTFISTISWDERRATFAAFITVACILIGPVFLRGMWLWFFGAGSGAQVLFSGISPLFPVLSVVPNPTGMRQWPVAVGFLPSHLLAWLLLLLSGRWVQSAWHSRSGSPVRRTVDERLFTPKNPVARARHRRRVLDAHPLVWLLERHPGKRFYADGLVVAIVIIWLWSYQNYGTDMFGGPGWYLIAPLAFTVHLILASWVVAESSMRLLEDRRSGALELLLCTSLTDRQIIAGHRLALQRLFLRPVLFLVAAEVFVAFNGFGTGTDDATVNGRWLMLGMATAVALDTYALSWIALWLASSLPNVNRVGIFALAITPFGPLILTAILVTALSFLTPGNYRPDFKTIIAIWVSLVALVDLVVGQWLCQRTVREQFRSLAVKVQPRAAVAA